MGKKTKRENQIPVEIYIKWPNVCVPGVQKERRGENRSYF